MVMSWCCHGVGHWNRLRSDRYDDLLLPGHRLLAQLPVEASEEHFKNRTLACSAKVPTLDHGNAMEIHGNIYHRDNTRERGPVTDPGFCRMSVLGR